MGGGFDPQRGPLLGLGRGHWCNSVSPSRVDPALNVYLEKSGEGKQEGCAKAKDGCPPTEEPETEMRTASLDIEGLVPSYLLAYLYILSPSLVFVAMKPVFSDLTFRPKLEGFLAN